MLTIVYAILLTPLRHLGLQEREPSAQTKRLGVQNEGKIPTWLSSVTSEAMNFVAYHLSI